MGFPPDGSGYSYFERVALASALLTPDRPQTPNLHTMRSSRGLRNNPLHTSKPASGGDRSTPYAGAESRWDVAS